MRIAIGGISHETTTIVGGFLGGRLLPVRRRARGRAEGAGHRRCRDSDGSSGLRAIDGVDVIVTSNRVLVLESSIHYRGAFEPLASRVIEMDTPSLSSADLSCYPHRHVRRPILPLDAFK
jgi:microcystin degradation protein MlrC